MRTLLIAATLLAACNTDDDVRRGTPDSACDSYPADAVDPMMVDEVIWPYSWPAARHRSDGREAPLDLGQVPCGADEDIDWSPFDVLLFVSIPAW